MLQYAPLLLALAASPSDPVRTATSTALVHEGEVLLGQLRCTACHAAGRDVQERLGMSSAPRLDAAGERLSPAWLRQFLSAPHADASGERMPNLLCALPEGEREQALEALVHHLASQGEGFESGPIAGGLEDLERGRQLFHSVGCVACHGPQEPLEDLGTPYWEFELEAGLAPPPAPEGSVRLPDLARKTSVPALARFLGAPHAVIDDGRMPDLRLEEDEARAIALYLLREQFLTLEDPYNDAPGIAYDYYEGNFSGPVANFEPLTPVRSGSAAHLNSLPDHRPDGFGFRFHGMVTVDEAGTYTFETDSDDGSRLWIGETLVVTNDGHHGMRKITGTIELAAGSHPIEVHMFEGGGGEGLRVRWAPPGAELAPIPGDRLMHRSLSWQTPDAADFELDEGLAGMGAMQFMRLGCVRCHAAGGQEAAPAQGRELALAQLDPKAAGGCTSATPSPQAAHYDLDEGERAALTAALTRPFALVRPLSDSERLERRLDAMRCTACHARGERGGPHESIEGYFQSVGDVDLGDQGRIPPELHETGSKLRRAWLEEVLLHGGRWRPYMATRMPQFGEDAVGELVKLFPAVDAHPEDAIEPPFSLEAVEAGRRLTGTNGLGCIQCHALAGNDSLGVPAVDLAQTRERLNPRWFHALLLDPAGLDMNTRMPNFWVDGKSPVDDVYDGDPSRQIDALWTYLSLGSAMPLPEGLVVADDEYELVVRDVPRTVGVFMKGVSPRTIAVGFPERAHYAFDVQNSRLAMAWRGRFFNARGTWHARAGALQEPPEEADVQPLPAGMPFARLASADEPWPSAVGNEAGYQAEARRFDSQRRPSFRYSYGNVWVDELPHPEIGPGGAHLVRRFWLRSDAPTRGLWLRAATGERIERDGEGWRVDGGMHVSATNGVELRVRETANGLELVAPVDFQSELTFDLEIDW